MAPEAAYLCERCPRLIFDPGPEIRTAWDLYCYIYSMSEGSALHESRWSEVLNGIGTGRRRLLENINLIREEELRLGRAREDQRLNKQRIRSVAHTERGSQQTARNG